MSHHHTRVAAACNDGRGRLEENSGNETAVGHVVAWQHAQSVLCPCLPLWYPTLSYAGVVGQVQQRQLEQPPELLLVACSTNAYALGTCSCTRLTTL